MPGRAEVTRTSSWGWNSASVAPWPTAWATLSCSRSSTLDLQVHHHLLVAQVGGARPAGRTAVDQEARGSASPPEAAHHPAGSSSVLVVQADGADGRSRRARWRRARRC